MPSHRQNLPGTHRQPARPAIERRTVVKLFLVGLILYALIAGFSGLRLSISAIRSADPLLVVVAAMLIVCSYICATTTYVLLSIKPLSFGAVFSVQIASGLVNRLLPAGLGGLGINLLFLKKRGYSIPAATAIVSLNNFLGLIGNILLVLVTSQFFVVSWPSLRLPSPSLPVTGGAFLAVVIVGVYAFYHHTFTTKITASFAQVGSYVLAAAHRPLRLLGALVSSCLLTAFHAAAMFCVLQSLDTGMAWPVALLAVSAGAFAGAALPSPGGLGGAEAGIVAALVAFTVPAPMAVAAALIYRGLTYWLPLLPGYLALRIVERRYL